MYTKECGPDVKCKNEFGELNSIRPNSNYWIVQNAIYRNCSVDCAGSEMNMCSNHLVWNCSKISV